MKNIQTLTLNEENITDFASARNMLLKKTKAEWVLFVDTDEKISNELKQEISDLNPIDYKGFIIKRKIVFLGSEIGEDRVLRLARRNSGKWVRKVHEIWRIKGKVGTLKNCIVHDTASNLFDYIEKMNRYSSIHAAENLKEGKRSNIFKMIFYPKLKFIQNILLGRGIVFSIMQSFHSFLGWTKQWELQKD